MNQPQALYQLQVLESTIDAAKKRVAEIEVALQNDDTVLRCRAELKTCETTLHQAQTIAKDMELEIASLDAKLQEGEKLLYGGTVKNPKELQEREEEIASLKRRRAARENDLLGAMEAVEQAKTAHQTAKDGLQAAEQTHASASRGMVEERDRLNHQMSDKLMERKNMLQIVSPENHKMYKQLKPQKNGVAVSRLDGDTCTACRVEQNQSTVYQVKQSKALVKCHNCGRILVEF